ncbi:MAG: ATP-binding protein [Crocosphaera sp.]|nr:ATP-binding protein [Crocosphaera sp.]
MSSNSDCPFYVGSTISDPRFFVGREEALTLLCNRLTEVQSSSINIVGHHGTGKSSLLVHFVNTYRQSIGNPEHFVVVYLSLQDAACNTQENFYSRIAKLLETNISSSQWQLRKLRNILRRENWDSSKFNNLFQEFKNQNILPVLCIDNFEELLERSEQFPGEFYDNLRYLVSNNFLMIIMASCELLDIYSKKKQITSDFFNVFQCVDLNDGFTPEEAEKLVRLTNIMGKGLSEDIRKKALKWGNREPLLLQLAGQILWETQVNRKSLRWAEKTFKTRSKRYNFSPKSPFLSFFYKRISEIGEGILWFNKNRKDLQKFGTGLIFLCVVTAILIAFSYGAIDFEQLKSLFQKGSKK